MRELLTHQGSSATRAGPRRECQRKQPDTTLARQPRDFYTSLIARDHPFAYPIPHTPKTHLHKPDSPPAPTLNPQTTHTHPSILPPSSFHPKPPHPKIPSIPPRHIAPTKPPQLLIQLLAPPAPLAQTRRPPDRTRRSGEKSTTWGRTFRRRRPEIEPAFPRRGDEITVRIERGRSHQRRVGGIWRREVPRSEESCTAALRAGEVGTVFDGRFARARRVLGFHFRI